MIDGVLASERLARVPLRAPARGQSGRYRLDGRIALGSTSSLWKATDLLLDRDVAIKRLRVRAANDPATRERFAREVRVNAAMQHPSVVAVLDADTQTARPYLVTEWVPGESLDQLLRRGPLPATTAVRIAATLARALAHVHGRNIVHCDVKPANILVRTDGRVKLADFGIATAVGTANDGTVFGSIHYMSPERLIGNAPSPACDVYALGVTLYEMITGRRPFTGDSPFEVASAHRRADVARSLGSGRIPAAVDRVLWQALAQDPGERFPSAAAFAAALTTTGQPNDQQVMAG